MPVESTWSRQCFVERFREICSGDDDDTLALRETVQFHKKLIERLFHVLLIVSSLSTHGLATLT
jgi:hypothetical protein